MSNRQPEHKPGVKLCCLFALLLWLPIPFGSKPEWAMILFSFLAVTLSLGWGLSFIVKGTRLGSVFLKGLPFHVGFLFIIFWLWLQQCPLPADWVEWLSPKAFAAYNNASLLIGEPLAAKIPLSLDPYNTRLAYWLTLGYWLVFSLVLGVVKSQKQLRALAWTLIAAGALQATVGTFSILSGFETLLLSEKKSYLGVATGTFVNRNSFAGFLEMTLAIGIGLQISELGESGRIRFKDRLVEFLTTLLSNKVLLRTCLAVMVIGMVMSRSRMGNAAFFASLVITGFLYVFCQRRLTKGVAFLFISLLAVDVAIVSQWFGLEQVIDRLEQTSLDHESRPNVAQLTVDIIRDYPLTGTGGGTYYTALPEYHDGSWRGFYDLAHNDLLQFPAEFGLPAYGILIAMVLLALWHGFQAMRQRKNPLMIGIGFGSFMGILAILIHSTVDFNLQIPANGAYFVVLMALAVHARYLPSKRSRLEVTKAERR